MPELPEVQNFKQYFDSSALQQRIAHTTVYDDKIIRNMTGVQFSEATRGRTFLDSYRRGKYLFARMDNDHHVLLHFGMTGDLNYYQDDLDRTKYERFVFHFENGFRLGFDCPRKFARILYLEDHKAYIRKINLGTDVLQMQAADFLTLSEGRNATVKGFLLNQKYLSGVGNLYADEVCYQTQIHPASRIGAIPRKKRSELFTKLQEVLRYAIDRGAYYKDYPENWLWQWRKPDHRAPDGSSISSDKIAGRTSYFSSDWQKLYR